MESLTEKQIEELEKQKILAELKTIWNMLDEMGKRVWETSNKLDKHMRKDNAQKN